MGNRQIDSGVRDLILEYLEKKKDEAEPHALKTVRTATKMELREEDNNIELPINYTERGMYIDWCYERGYTAKLKGATAGYRKLVDYADQEVDNIR